MLKQAITCYGKPKSILSEHGVQFYAVEADTKEKGLTEFGKFLMRNHIRHTVGRVNHLQTKPSNEIGRKIKLFSSIDDCVCWCNTIKPRDALKLKTPIGAYYGKIPQKDVLIYRQSLRRKYHPRCEIIFVKNPTI